MEKFFSLIIIVIALTGCGTEDLPEFGNCQETFTRYSCNAGEFESHPARIYTRNNAESGGAWEIYIENGWNYRLHANQKQWLKLCGDSFGSNLESVIDNPNAVMLAGRYDLENDRIQITPYFNKNGFPHYPELFAANDTWPVITVDEKDLIRFSYTVEYGPVSDRDKRPDRIVIVLSVGEPVRIMHTMYFPMEFDSFTWKREISFYAGGSVPPVKTISILKMRLCELPTSF